MKHLLDDWILSLEARKKVKRNVFCSLTHSHIVKTIFHTFRSHKTSTSFLFHTSKRMLWIGDAISTTTNGNKRRQKSRFSKFFPLRLIYWCFSDFQDRFTIQSSMRSYAKRWNMTWNSGVTSGIAWTYPDISHLVASVFSCFSLASRFLLSFHYSKVCSCVCLCFVFNASCDSTSEQTKDYKIMSSS